MIPPPTSDPSAIPVTALRGVGPERATQLQRLGITTVLDLLLHRPRRYEDRRQFLPIRSLTLGVSAAVRGTVRAAGTKAFSGGRKSMFEIVVEDESSRLYCRWWGPTFLERMIAPGDDLLVFGRVTSDRPRAMDHPELEKVLADDEVQIHISRIVPVHPLTEGLTARVMRSLVWQACATHADHAQEPHEGLIPTGEDPSFLRQDQPPVGDLLTIARPLPAKYPRRSQALRWLQFPETAAHASWARLRLALDEFLDLQLALRRRRQRLEAEARAIPCSGTNLWIKPMLSRLGFTPTSAQTRVLRDIRQDLGGPVPMRRLLQGDVGSGKTLVAACSALMTLESGHSVALMAPTEILASQLAARLAGWFGPMQIPVRIRTSSHDEWLSGKPSDSPRVTVGTHALLESSVDLGSLGLVIIDEQHRFGVTHRERLLKRGKYPHLLVMTATPIPRTLGLTVYGDLDISVIDELPGGRQPIRTHVRKPSAMPKVLDFLGKELDAGGQAYIVCPRIEDSDEQDARAVKKEAAEIRKHLSRHSIDVLHGQMTSPERDAAMDAFRTGKTRVLVATSIIEVGVDVPNASVMVIRDAGKFGLAQLHQLRGRIGRGTRASHCILIDEGSQVTASERLQTLARSTDGFAIAEADLRIRGPGELLGRTQSGIPDLKFGDLTDDGALLEFARHLAIESLSSSVKAASRDIGRH